MKATDLNQALSYVDEAYLREADAPDKEMLSMKNRKRTHIILAAAVLTSLLSITVYAAELLHIRSLESGSSKYYETYSDMGRALTQAGLETAIPEAFSNGFRFQEAEVQEVKAKDESGNLVMTLQELKVTYTNDLGQYLRLCAGRDFEALPKTDSIPVSIHTIGNAEVKYYLDHYKFVPPDYKLSAEEREWAEQPGNYVSYGSDQVEEADKAFLCWTEGDIYYFFFDPKAAVSADTLVAMAGEMIQK